MQKSGIVEHTIFRNNDNGYSVVLLDVDGEPITVTGTFPTLTEGEMVLVEGDYKNSKYGLQFVCTRCEIFPPSDELSIIRYLSSGLIKGVGVATAENIVKVFGSQSLHVIEHQPHILKSVKGISAKRAVDIANNFNSIKKLQKAVMFLQNLGVTINMAMKIHEVYGDSTEANVIKNPYQLIEDIDGIGFLTADNVATKLGITYDSEFRLRAATLYMIKNFSDTTGSTYIPLDILCERLSRLLGVEMPPNRLDGVLKQLSINMQIRVSQTIVGEMRVSTLKLYNTERSVAKRLLDLQRQYEKLPLDIDLEITEYERANKIVLHEGQKLAVKNAVTDGVVVITGGPGTGKTTIVKCILNILSARGINCELVAPTGRAAKRMSVATGKEAKTIHRLLDIDFKDGKGYFTYDENTRLDCNALICDEVSMVDAYLMSNLLSALKLGTKLILVGDKDQLPSVGAGNVLSDIISSGLINVVMLTEIYRQDSESLIVTNAHKINKGIMPSIGGGNDFFFSGEDDPDAIVNAVTGMVTTRIPKFKNVQPSSIQVLCPMKKGTCGSLALNLKLQELLNPRSSQKQEFTIDGATFRLGDKVMQMANNYQLEWRKGLYEIGTGVFNGDIGYLSKINTDSGEVEIEFDDGRISIYSQTDLVDINLAYAISIHKSQGSEFDIVVIPITGGHRGLFTRNLLYTGVTRAKSMVVLVGSKKNIQFMVENDYTEKRYSLLGDFLKQDEHI